MVTFHGRQKMNSVITMTVVFGSVVVVRQVDRRSKMSRGEINVIFRAFEKSVRCFVWLVGQIAMSWFSLLRCRMVRILMILIRFGWKCSFVISVKAIVIEQAFQCCPPFHIATFASSITLSTDPTSMIGLLHATVVFSCRINCFFDVQWKCFWSRSIASLFATEYHPAGLPCWDFIEIGACWTRCFGISITYPRGISGVRANGECTLTTGRQKNFNATILSMLESLAYMVWA